MADRILVVDDETTLRTNVTRYLVRAGYAVTAAASGEEALAALENATFDIVITDLRLPVLDGLAVLDRVRAVSPETFVLIMTAYASVESAVDALRRGAHDYVLKPLSLADLLRKVENAASYHRLHRENARLRAQLHGQDRAIDLLRRSGKAIGPLCDAIERVAASRSNVLLVGESGVGKGTVARALHECGDRARGPFVTFHAGAVPEASAETYLFGSERAEWSEGVLRAASGGTLFLDEVADLSLAVQAKLVAAIESKQVFPVGADAPRRVDTRIVAATQLDLAARVEEGLFRRDLFDRLCVASLVVPRLRDRAADVPALTRHFVERHAHELNKPVPTVSREAMALLAKHDWPGNLRELSNVLERAVILASGGTLTPVDLPPEIATAPVTRAADRVEPAPVEPPAADAPPDLESATTTFQRRHVASVLDRVGGRREAAAQLLGLSPATLYRYLQKLDLKGYRQ